MSNVYSFLSPWAVGLCLMLSMLLPFGLLHHRQQHQGNTLRLTHIAQLLLLRQLLANLQRHRGLSNGVLAGDQGLLNDLAGIREQLDRQMQAAEQLSTQHTDAWQGLVDHWSRLRQGGSQDAANNLAQHHQIIRNCIFLIEDVASELDLSHAGEEFDYLRCLWREVVQTAEWAGQARALGTGIAAAQLSSPEQRVRMRFLHQKIQQLSGSAFNTLENSLSNRFEGDLGQCKMRVREYLDCIEQNLLNNEQPEIDAKAYFSRATQAIDELFALVDAGLSHIQRDDSITARHRRARGCVE